MNGTKYGSKNSASLFNTKTPLPSKTKSMTKRITASTTSNIDPAALICNGHENRVIPSSILKKNIFIQPSNIINKGKGDSSHSNAQSGNTSFKMDENLNKLLNISNNDTKKPPRQGQTVRSNLLISEKLEQKKNKSFQIPLTSNNVVSKKPQPQIMEAALHKSSRGNRAMTGLVNSNPMSSTFFAAIGIGTKCLKSSNGMTELREIEMKQLKELHNKNNKLFNSKKATTTNSGTNSGTTSTANSNAKLSILNLNNTNSNTTTTAIATNSNTSNHLQNNINEMNSNVNGNLKINEDVFNFTRDDKNSTNNNPAERHAGSSYITASYSELAKKLKRSKPCNGRPSSGFQFANQICISGIQEGSGQLIVSGEEKKRLESSIVSEVDDDRSKEKNSSVKFKRNRGLHELYKDDIVDHIPSMSQNVSMGLNNKDHAFRYTSHVKENQASFSQCRSKNSMNNSLAAGIKSEQVSSMRLRDQCRDGLNPDNDRIDNPSQSVRFMTRFSNVNGPEDLHFIYVQLSHQKKSLAVNFEKNLNDQRLEIAFDENLELENN